MAYGGIGDFMRLLLNKKIPLNTTNEKRRLLNNVIIYQNVEQKNVIKLKYIT